MQLRDFFLSIGSLFTNLFQQPDWHNVVDVLILNRVEALQLLGRRMEDPEQILYALSALCPGAQIALTLGAEGAVLYQNGACFLQAAFPVKAVDTTGAGDTFTGYLLAGLMEEPAAALRLAAAAAALAVTRPGAAPAIPSREETLRFLTEQSRTEAVI